MGEHPADFTSDKVMPQLMSTWGSEMEFKMPDPNDKKTGEAGGGQTQNLNQSKIGIQNGASGNQGGDKTLVPNM